jgi:hypothetical protein
MFKELFVVLKAKFSDLFRGLKEVVGVTQGAAKQMNASAQRNGRGFNLCFFWAIKK